MTEMNLLFKFRVNKPEYVEAFVRWYNDPEIRDFLHPNFTGKTREDITTVEVGKMVERSSPDVTEYLIFDGDRLIGECSITQTFPHLFKFTEDTAWISLCIGEKDLWGKGVATQAMLFLEDQCRKKGFSRIELGVFEHNMRARNLYAKLGYQEIARIENFTFDVTGWHADIRMDKTL